jgi:hypothetical protein
MRNEYRDMKGKGGLRADKWDTIGYWKAGAKYLRWKEAWNISRTAWFFYTGRIRSLRNVGKFLLNSNFHIHHCGSLKSYLTSRWAGLLSTPAQPPFLGGLQRWTCNWLDARYRAASELAGYEVLTAVTMKSTVPCVVTPCNSEITRRFGITCLLHLQGWRVSQASTQQKQVAAWCYCFLAFWGLQPKRPYFHLLHL